MVRLSDHYLKTAIHANEGAQVPLLKGHTQLIYRDHFHRVALYRLLHCTCLWMSISLNNYIPVMKGWILLIFSLIWLTATWLSTSWVKPVGNRPATVLTLMVLLCGVSPITIGRREVTTGFSRSLGERWRTQWFPYVHKIKGWVYTGCLKEHVLSERWFKWCV